MRAASEETQLKGAGSGRVVTLRGLGKMFGAETRDGNSVKSNVGTGGCGNWYTVDRLLTT